MSEFSARDHAEDALGPGPSRPGPRRPGVVAHSAGPLPDGALGGVLRSSRNAVAALGPDVPVEAVIQGPGVARLAKGAGSEEAISAAVADGVGVLACGNSLRSAGVSAADLLPGVEIVPAAIAHVAERQWGGWAYIRL